MEKRTANVMLKQTPVHEPSPASTYGETLVGDSVPATPLGKWFSLRFYHLALYTSLEVAVGSFVSVSCRHSL